MKVFREGDRCRGFPIVLQGEVAVRQQYPSGRAIELYRIGPGDSCLLSLQALTGGVDVYHAHAVATRDSRIQLLDAGEFDLRLAQDPAFRRQILANFSSRLLALTDLVEDLIERRLDQRMALLLVRLGPLVAVTHAELASELGSVREVVSRILTRFQRAGWVRLSRGEIAILDSDRLAHFGSGAL